MNSLKKMNLFKNFEKNCYMIHLNEFKLLSK